VNVSEFVHSIPGFSGKNHPEKIKAFGWFLHAHVKADRFGAAEIRRCYDDSNQDPPANMHRFLESLAEKRPPDLLKDARGYRLAQAVREQHDRTLGRVEAVITIEKMLTDLPGLIADESERVFLTEALTCYRHGAFRAAIVMAWNLAYDHLARWILADAPRLANFNAGIAKKNSQKAHITIAKREDFEGLTENETVEIAAKLPAFSANVATSLKEKLRRRNTYAHPSLHKATRAQVDDMITDLVHNVVLRLTL
jgi:hypothetical protein